jgi:hypothetical protein
MSKMHDCHLVYFYGQRQTGIMKLIDSMPFLVPVPRPEAQALYSKLVAMQMDAGLTIAMRMPIFARAALGDDASGGEARKAVTEKIAAVTETGMAAGQAAAEFWWNMFMAPVTQARTGELAARAANQMLEPMSRRTSANATRLGNKPAASKGRRKKA